MNPSLLFLINLLSTWYLVGLIWTIQIVHYKLFHRVGDEAFAKYEQDHTRLMTPIVAVPMLIELATGCILVIHAPSVLPYWVRWIGLIMIGVIWLTTFFVSVPCHAKLQTGFDAVTYKRLLKTNWIRTVLWTARGAVLGYFAALMMN